MAGSGPLCVTLFKAPLSLYNPHWPLLLDHEKQLLACHDFHIVFSPLQAGISSLLSAPRLVSPDPRLSATSPLLLFFLSPGCFSCGPYPGTPSHSCLIPTWPSLISCEGSGYGLPVPSAMHALVTPLCAHQISHAGVELCLPAQFLCVSRGQHTVGMNEWPF